MKRPPGLSIIVGLEGLAGILLLFQAAAFQAVKSPLPSIVLLALAILILASAIGLWFLKKWAWFSIMGFSLLSIALGAVSFAAKIFMGSEYLLSSILLSIAPKLILDFIVVIYLFNRRVRMFYGI